MKNIALFLVAVALCALAGCMSNEIEPDRGPTPGIINIAY